MTFGTFLPLRSAGVSMPSRSRVRSECGDSGAHTTRVSCGPQSSFANSLSPSKLKMYSSPRRPMAAAPDLIAAMRPIAVSEVMMRTRAPVSRATASDTAAVSA